MEENFMTMNAKDTIVTGVIKTDKGNVTFMVKTLNLLS